MASAPDMNYALRNTLIELQRYALVLLLCFSCLLASADSQELSKDEMDALQALKRAWNTSISNSDSFISWNSSLPCGDLHSAPSRTGGWLGVTCDVNSTWPTGVTVTELSLLQHRINVGVIPSEVAKLSNLVRINLRSAGNLSGPIPKEIVQLRNLTFLRIEDNMFFGQFPFSSSMEGSKLQELSIGWNQFNGTIENDAFRNLGQLELLSLSKNNFTGKVPDLSPMQTNLKTLDLSYNKFTGEAPDVSKLNLTYLPNFTISQSDVSTLLFLEHLNLSKNEFTGQAPDVSKLSQLLYLDMSWNKFEGQTPNVSTLANLEFMNLSTNEFTGQAPDVSKLSQLRYLDMSWNKFEGQTPNVFRLANLQVMDLSHNKFRGQAPDLYYWSELHSLDLSSNNFTELSNGLYLFLNKLPRNLVQLDLSSLHVGGPAPYWANLSLPKSLTHLYLDANNFTGTLDLSAFFESNASRSLEILSLKDNMITDVIVPDSILITFAVRFTKIILQGNPYCNKNWTTQDETTICSLLCAEPCVYKPPSKKMDRKIIIMASSISSGVILLVILGFGFVLRGKEKYIRDLQKKIKEADVNAKRFDYNELRVATNNFGPEMKLGEGGYGAVYKGILAGNIVVAVKQLLLNTIASREDFVNEILLISNLQHRNLVALKGYCLNDRQTLLVYEYVDNSDLDKLLLSRHDNTGSTFQTLQLWKTRLKICQGVAQGLYYLHTSSQSRILHRDIKASNILLDKNFEAKVADFGLARLIAGSVTMTSGCAGTIGYLAPEYASTGQLSDKADVYSFGVLLLEIVSGMGNRDQRLPEDEVHLTTWARKLHRMNRLLDMKDPTLIVSEDEAEEVRRVLETAVLCVQNDPKKRPSMILVAAMLAGKASGDALPPIDEELDVFSAELPSDESDCDLNPLFVSSAPGSLASQPAGNPQIELSSSQKVKLWRTG